MSKETEWIRLRTGAWKKIVSAARDSSPPLLEKSVLGPRASLSGLPPARSLEWKVEAISRGGRRWNAGGEGGFAAPPLEKLRGTTFASDLEWLRATAGAGNKVHRDTNYHGKTIAIAGKTYRKGLWTHSFDDGTPADVVIDLSGRSFASFAADAGVEDSSGGGSVEFQVLLDGALKARSPLLRPGSVHRFRVDTSGAKEITLRVLNGGDGYTCDHAAWGFARFIETGAVDTLGEEK